MIGLTAVSAHIGNAHALGGPSIDLRTSAANSDIRTRLDGGVAGAQRLGRLGAGGRFAAAARTER